MRITITELQEKLEAGMPGANIKILDPQNDGVHLGAQIVWEEFEGKNRLARHRLVYKALGNAFDNDYLHALQLSTLAPSEAK